MKQASHVSRTAVAFGLWAGAACLGLVADEVLPRQGMLPSSISTWRLGALVAGIFASSYLCVLCSEWMLTRQRKPAVEGMMLGRIYRMVALLVVALAVAYGFGRLSAVGSFFTLFGGMLLGWSLQAPVSGFAAWVLVSLKRPFRPGGG